MPFCIAIDLQGGKKAILFHSTLYDGALERAAIDLGVPTFGISCDLNAIKLSTKSVRNMLLEEWKAGHGKAEYGGVKFVAQPDAAADDGEAEPTMQLCKILGEGGEKVLSVPTDVRQKWLADPSHAPEWRCLLRRFDAKHGVAPVPHEGQLAIQAPAAENGAPSPDAGWGTIFADDPKTIAALEQKFPKIAASFTLSEGDGLVCYVVEGPQIFVAAPTNAGSLLGSQVILGHGGGIWLLDAKATKAIQDQF